MKDHYGMLGIERDATLEAIKLAYRRLARASHPDMVSHEGEGAEVLASHRMADLNEAYAVLSHPSDRAEYDRKLAGTSGTPHKDLAETLREDAVRAEETSRVSEKQRTRPSGGGRVVDNVVGAFLGHVHRELVGGGASASFKDVEVEGFEWAVQAKRLTHRDWILARGYQDLTVDHVKRYQRYAERARGEAKGILRSHRMLFVLGFYRMSDPEALLATCRRIGASMQRESKGGTESFLVLIDVATGRLVPMGKVDKGSWVTEMLAPFHVRGSRSRGRD